MAAAGLAPTNWMVFWPAWHGTRDALRRLILLEVEAMLWAQDPPLRRDEIVAEPIRTAGYADRWHSQGLF